VLYATNNTDVYLKATLILIKGESTMDITNARFDFPRKFTAPTLDTANRAAVDGLGGEELEGSGFEDEMPEAEFQFDWTVRDQSEGDLQ
jgi:hypothetical protein